MNAISDLYSRGLSTADYRPPEGDYFASDEVPGRPSAKNTAQKATAASNELIKAIEAAQKISGTQPIIDPEAERRKGFSGKIFAGGWYDVDPKTGELMTEAYKSSQQINKEIAKFFKLEGRSPEQYEVESMFPGFMGGSFGGQPFTHGGGRYPGQAELYEHHMGKLKQISEYGKTPMPTPTPTWYATSEETARKYPLIEQQERERQARQAAADFAIRGGRY